MIKLEFSAAVALYLSLTALALIFYWLFFEKPKDMSNKSVSDRNVWRCSICAYFYIDSKHSTISVCPRCGSYNKKEEAISQKEAKV